MIPKRRETNRVTTTTIPVAVLRGFSGDGTDRGAQEKPANSLVEKTVLRAQGN